ncbi:MAG TPA: hypothetical protein VER96_13615 [Polyangiaceae bacterium]|nr:hypothetical protein [Polyangiaceae bacterium]
MTTPGAPPPPTDEERRELERAGIRSRPGLSPGTKRTLQLLAYVLAGVVGLVMVLAFVGVVLFVVVVGWLSKGCSGH